MHRVEDLGALGDEHTLGQTRCAARVHEEARVLLRRLDRFDVVARGEDVLVAQVVGRIADRVPDEDHLLDPRRRSNPVDHLGEEEVDDDDLAVGVGDDVLELLRARSAG